MSIGGNIKEIRLDHNLTQEKLGEMLSVSRSTVSSWEVERNYPDLETLVKISDLFSISLDKLLKEDIKMVKNVSRKISMNKYYKIIIITIIIIILAYFGYNLKLRMDLNKYRTNLENSGWENKIPSTSVVVADRQSSYYELDENGITYWTFLLDADLIGIPLSEQRPNIYAKKSDIVVSVKKKNNYEAVIPLENNNLITITMDRNGDLLGNTSNLSDKEKVQIKKFMKKDGKTLKNLISQADRKWKDIIK